MKTVLLVFIVLVNLATPSTLLLGSRSGLAPKITKTKLVLGTSATKPPFNAFLVVPLALVSLLPNVKRSASHQRTSVTLQHTLATKRHPDGELTNHLAKSNALITSTSANRTKLARNRRTEEESLNPIARLLANLPMSLQSSCLVTIEASKSTKATSRENGKLPLTQKTQSFTIQPTKLGPREPQKRFKTNYGLTLQKESEKESTPSIISLKSVF
jgi:hypothetical protein